LGIYFDAVFLMAPTGFWGGGAFPPKGRGKKIFFFFFFFSGVAGSSENGGGFFAVSPGKRFFSVGDFFFGIGEKKPEKVEFTSFKEKFGPANFLRLVF